LSHSLQKLEAKADSSAFEFLKHNKRARFTDPKYIFSFKIRQKQYFRIPKLAKPTSLALSAKMTVSTQANAEHEQITIIP